MEEEAIYCNGISYLYFFSWLLCGDGCFSEREKGRVIRRGRFSFSAGCLSAWGGQEEADKWEWVGVQTEQERGRAGLYVICRRLKSKLLTDEKIRFLSGLPPAQQTSVWQHAPFHPFFFFFFLLRGWCLFRVISNFGSLLATCLPPTLTCLLALIFISNAVKINEVT